MGSRISTTANNSGGASSSSSRKKPATKALSLANRDPNSHSAVRHDSRLPIDLIPCSVSSTSKRRAILMPACFRSTSNDVSGSPTCNGTANNHASTITSASDKLISSLDKKVLQIVRTRYPSFKTSSERQPRSQAAATSAPLEDKNQKTPESCTQSSRSRPDLPDQSTISDRAGCRSYTGSCDVFIYPPNYCKSDDYPERPGDSKMSNRIEIEVSTSQRAVGGEARLHDEPARSAQKCSHFLQNGIGAKDCRNGQTEKSSRGAVGLTRNGDNLCDSARCGRQKLGVPLPPPSEPLGWTVLNVNGGQMDRVSDVKFVDCDGALIRSAVCKIIIGDSGELQSDRPQSGRARKESEDGRTDDGEFAGIVSDQNSATVASAQWNPGQLLDKSTSTDFGGHKGQLPNCVPGDNTLDTHIVGSNAGGNGVWSSIASQADSKQNLTSTGVNLIEAPTDHSLNFELPSMEPATSAICSRSASVPNTSSYQCPDESAPMNSCFRGQQGNSRWTSHESRITNKYAALGDELRAASTETMVNPRTSAARSIQTSSENSAFQSSEHSFLAASMITIRNLDDRIKSMSDYDLSSSLEQEEIRGEDNSAERPPGNGSALNSIDRRTQARNSNSLCDVHLETNGQAAAAEDGNQIKRTKSSRSKRSKFNRQASLSDDLIDLNGDKKLARQPMDMRVEDRNANLDYDAKIYESFVEGKASSGQAIMSTSISTLSDEIGDKIDYSPILTSMKNYIENVNAELELDAQASPSVLVGATMAQPMMCAQPTMTTRESAIQTLLPSPTILTTMTLAAGASISSSGATLTAEAHEPPKKSIFEGASKDEILEYLEDARERVPDILIAADEVMVLGENELLLVDQLEPNLPATPISIADPSEAVASVEFCALEHVAATMQQPAISLASTVMSLGTLDENAVGMLESQSFSEHGSFANDEHQSSLVNFESSLDPTLLANTVDHSLVPSSPESNIVRDFDRSYNQTIDSVERQLAMTDFMTPHKHLSMPSTSSMSNNSSNKGTDEESPSNNHLRISDRVTSMLHHSTRRKSNSESSSQAKSRRVNKLISMQLGCHSKTHELLPKLSTSSSPWSTSTPASLSSSSSSSSNTRSSSSNHTSGNCSAASNYYNSPSVSRSSPSLASGSNMILGTSICNPSGAPSLYDPLSSFIGDTSQQVGLYESDNMVLTLPQAATNDDDLRSNDDHSQVAQLALQYKNSPVSRSSCVTLQQLDLVERADSGLGPLVESSSSSSLDTTKSAAFRYSYKSKFTVDQPQCSQYTEAAPLATCKLDQNKTNTDMVMNGDSSDCELVVPLCASRLSIIDENTQDKTGLNVGSNHTSGDDVDSKATGAAFVQRKVLFKGRDLGHNDKKTIGLGRPSHSHYATINRLNDYLIKRQEMSSLGDLAGKDHSMIEFQCLDCDQFIRTDQAAVLRKANELRLLRESGIESLDDTCKQQMSLEQIDRAYVAALNGLPLCKACEKKRGERKEIISEFVETELAYGRDLNIIHDNFYRPLQIAGLLNKEQTNGIFLNLDELIMAHCRFAERLKRAISETQALGDTDFNTVNIGKLFVESAEMLHAFESYCIRQGTAACLLARLSKEKELFRIFLRASQMENPVLRRMNLETFLMVPVQRVTKYPLLLNRLYKVTAYHHKDREALRDAQLRVELHLVHINRQTKGTSATNKIWRRISALSASSSTAAATSRRGLISAEDIGYIKLRNSAMELLNWDRDETRFIHSGKLSFAPLNEFIVRQKMKSLRYIATHALLIVLGKPNLKYRPDLVKSSLDSKQLAPTAGGNGIREAALLLFREKNGRYVACREPLLLSKCVLSNDCSQFNVEQSHHHFGAKLMTNSSASMPNSHPNLATVTPASLFNRRSSPGVTTSTKRDLVTLNEFRAASAESKPSITERLASKPRDSSSAGHSLPNKPLHSISLHSQESGVGASDRSQGDSISMSSLKSLPEDQSLALISPPAQTSRSHSLASALPRAPISTSAGSSSINLASKSPCCTTSNLNILNPFKSKTCNHSGSNGGKQKLSSASKSSSASDKPAPRTANDVNGGTKNKTFLSTSSTDSAASQNLHDSTANPGSIAQGCSDRSEMLGLKTNGHQQSQADQQQSHQYIHLFFHNHHQPYGDYEESFELHECISKESLLLRADTPLKTRYWLQMLRYHAKDLGQWRSRRQGLSNIMIMHQE